MTYKLAVSTYSFSRFDLGPPWPGFEHVVKTCVDLGIDGLEVLGYHLRDASQQDLRDLKALCARKGIAIVSVSANHNFVNPDRARRMEDVDIVARWVDAARDLGAPFVRAFGGRWETLTWTDFMANRGEEPPREGYSDDDAYDWSVEAFKIASYYAGRSGVTLAIENHWGLTGTADGVLRIVRSTESPWLRVALDTGNFPYRPDPYAEMAALAPLAGMVHAKTYLGGGLHYDVDVDFRRVGRILRDAGFHGYVSIEHEGKAHPDQALPHSVKMLREAFAGL